MGTARLGMMIALGIACAGICAARPLGRTQEQAGTPQAAQQDSKTKAGAGKVTARSWTEEPQADPVVAAAQRAREQQKNKPKPAKVWTNEDIPGAGGVSVIGTPESAGRKGEGENAEAGGSGASNSQAGSQAKAQAGAASSSDSGADAAEIQAKLDAAKKNLKDVQTQLDLAQRTYKLDQQMYYVKPDYSSDTAGAAKLKNEEEQIGLKQQQMTNAQKQVDDLQSELDAAKGGAAGGAH